MKLRWKKVVMALSVFCGMNGIALIWGHAEARSLVHERGLEWGRGLYATATMLEQLSEGRGSERGHVQHLSLNGANVRVHTGSVSSQRIGITDLVRRATESCRTPLVGERGSGDFEVPPLVWTGPDEAFVYCLKAAETWTERTVRARLAAFRESGDVSEWGRFQGAYFKRVGDRIMIVSGEVLDGLEPEKLFPDEGDARGTNIARLPQPPGRRMLSVAHEGSTALTVHASQINTTKLLDEYHLKLIEQGQSVERAREDSRALVVRDPTGAYVVTSRPAKTGSHLVIARLPR